jgi:hypothetical protein
MPITDHAQWSVKVSALRKAANVRWGSKMRNTRIEPKFSALAPQLETSPGTVRRCRKGQYRQIYSGRAFPLCPCRSDINLFGNGEGVVDLNTKVSDGAFDLGVAEQELNSPQVAGAAIDQGCL